MRDLKQSGAASCNWRELSHAGKTRNAAKRVGRGNMAPCNRRKEGERIPPERIGVNYIQV